MSNKKIGRPVVDDPRDTTIAVRFNSKELEELDYCCKSMNAARPDVVREGVHRQYKRLKKSTKTE